MITEKDLQFFNRVWRDLFPRSHTDLLLENLGESEDHPGVYTEQCLSSGSSNISIYYMAGEPEPYIVQAASYVSGGRDYPPDMDVTDLEAFEAGKLRGAFEAMLRYHFNDVMSGAMECIAQDIEWAEEGGERPL